MALGQSLFDQLAAGAAGGAEYDQFHVVLLDKLLLVSYR